jgi:hypothetical protein
LSVNVVDGRGEENQGAYRPTVIAGFGLRVERTHVGCCFVGLRVKKEALVHALGGVAGEKNRHAPEDGVCGRV